MDRRDFLKIGAASLIAFPNIILGKEVEIKEKKIYLYNIHTGETFNEMFYQAGDYNLDILVDLTKFLRDFRTNDMFPVDINLVDYVAEIQKLTGVKAPLLVNSGYRSPKTNKYLKSIGRHVADKSFHMEGKAIDISLDPRTRVSLSSVKKKSLNLKLGGVGYYPNNGFIHLDTGDFRYWKG